MSVTAKVSPSAKRTGEREAVVQKIEIGVLADGEIAVTRRARNR
jgi:hypothetical protein